MRFFEMLFVILNIGMIGWVIYARDKTQRSLLMSAGISAIIMLLHALIEGMRWQMIPAYAMTVIPLVIVTVKLVSRPEKSEERT